MVSPSRSANLFVHSSARFFDFEGRSEGRAAVEYLARVAPRRLALVHGSTAARAALAGVLRRELTYHGTQVFTPGEAVGSFGRLRVIARRGIPSIDAGSSGESSRLPVPSDCLC